MNFLGGEKPAPPRERLQGEMQENSSLDLWTYQGRLTVVENLDLSK